MSVDGTPITGLVYTDFTLWYASVGVAVPIVLVAEDVVETGDGWYHIAIPDAAFATGVISVLVGGTCTGGVLISAPIGIDSVARITITPSADPAKVTGWIRVWDETTSPEPGVVIQVRQWSAAAQEAYDATIQEWTADATGVASGPLWVGETYQWRRGRGDWSVPFMAVDDGGDLAGTMRLPGNIGSP